MVDIPSVEVEELRDPETGRTLACREADGEITTYGDCQHALAKAAYHWRQQRAISPRLRAVLRAAVEQEKADSASDPNIGRMAFIKAEAAFMRSTERLNDAVRALTPEERAWCEGTSDTAGGKGK